MLGLLRVATLVSLLASSLQVMAATPQGTQAPYLAVVGDQVEHVPLASTQVEVTIAGVIADVTVKQVYENRGDVPIEALYVFPGSSRAAVYGLKMKVGDRVITARIAEKEKARETYEQARAEGKTASLLEQLDPSIFRMNVANVLPGDRIEVELKYTELLVPDRGTYEFVFPNTMGSRYGETLPVETSTSDEVIDYAFSIHARVRSAIPLKDVTSPSHAVNVSYPSTMNAEVALSEAEMQRAGAKDYVLRYSLAGDSIQSGMLIYPESDGGYFLMMAEPPSRTSEGAIPPREFIFVVDVSGSMIGPPLDVSKQLMRELFQSLRPVDFFNVILFSGDSRVLSESGSIAAVPENLERVLAILSDEAGGGGTELVEALKVAYALPQTSVVARSVIVITDGQISAGGEAFTTARSQLGQANTFAFGIGGNVDRDVIDLIARAGSGESFILENLDASDAVATRLRSYIDRPLLTRVTLRPENFDAYDMEPERVADLLAERPIIVVGRYRGEVKGDILVGGITGEGSYQQAVAPDAHSVSKDLSALRLLWARQRMQRLQDEQSTAGWGAAPEPVSAHVSEITRLSLAYGLLSPYTSFVAVDEVVRTAETAQTVQQPAIAKEAAAAPPPPPAPSVMRYSVGATGSALGLIRSIGAVVNSHARSSGKEVESRRIGERDFELRDGIWTDRTFHEGMTVLRLRSDSPALQRLLKSRPELVDVLALGKQVLVVVGKIALLVGPRGFSDYPESTMNQLLRG